MHSAFLLLCLLAIALPFLVDYLPDLSTFPTDPATLPAPLENLRPGQLRDAVAQGASVLLPIGSLVSNPADAPLGAVESAAQQALIQLANQRRAVIAPTIWYAPTGYVHGQAADGTFDLPTMAFVAYLRETIMALQAIGFKQVVVVVLDHGQGTDNLAYAACQYVLGDLMNNAWRAPGFGKGWWANPETKVMAWEMTGLHLLKLPAIPPASKQAALTLPLRLEQMRPSELREAIRRGLPCFVPTGVIENHGNHNPVGVDGFEAEDPLVLAAAQAAAVVAPTIWYGGTSYAVSVPELGTMDISGDTFYQYALGVAQGLAAMGFRRVIFVHVHQSGGAQDTALKLVSQEYKRLVAARAPMVNPDACIEEMATPSGMYDHAGKNETSWMLYLRGSCTDLSLLRPHDYQFCWEKEGESHRASAEWGRQMTERALARYIELFAEKTATPATGQPPSELTVQPVLPPLAPATSQPMAT